MNPPLRDYTLGLNQLSLNPRKRLPLGFPVRDLLRAGRIASNNIMPTFAAKA